MKLAQGRDRAFVEVGYPEAHDRVVLNATHDRVGVLTYIIPLGVVWRQFIRRYLSASAPTLKIAHITNINILTATASTIISF